MKNIFATVTLLYLFILPSTLSAQWSNDASVNTLVCSGNHNRNMKQIISDGSGGIFCCWYEEENDTTNTVNVQHINNQGVVQWTDGGVIVYSGPSLVEAPNMAAVGDGGVIVAWKNDDSSNAFAQRLNAAGTPQWKAQGINISNDYLGLDDYDPHMISDGTGGAFIEWDGAFSVGIIRLDSSGTVAWNTSATLYEGGIDSRIVSDGAGGVIVVWSEARNSGNGDYGDLFAQRVDGTGKTQWIKGGVTVCNATNMQSYPHIVPDGSGGAVIVWQDFRDGANYKPYGQRLDANGNRLWITGTDSNGVSICSEVDAMGDVFVTPDGSGGGIFAWDDSRTNDDDIYAQRINAAGKVQWDTNSVPVCIQSAPQADPRICSDGAGGAIIVWDDNRNSGANQDIYAQRIDGAGAVQWATNGVPVSSASGNQNLPLLISNPSGGAIVIWDDYRNPGSGYTNRDFYIQTLNTQGTLTNVRSAESQSPNMFQLSQNYPNPFNPTTTLRFTLKVSGFTTLKVYDAIGREVATLVNEDLEAGKYYEKTFNASNLSSGIYFARLSSEGESQVKKLMLIK